MRSPAAFHARERIVKSIRSNILAFAILICTGLTVDLRYFDFPTTAAFLLAGIAIGCRDRYKRGQADAGGGVADPARSRHG